MSWPRATALFGSGPGSASGTGSTASKVMPSLVHSAQTAMLVNLCFIVLALACACGLPPQLADQPEDPQAAPGEPEGDGGQQSPDPHARSCQAR